MLNSEAIDDKPTRDAVAKHLPWVQDVMFSTGVTPEGTSAVVVHLVVRSETDGCDDGARLAEAARVVLEAFVSRGLPWPHVRFISIEDQRRAVRVRRTRRLPALTDAGRVAHRPRAAGRRPLPA